MSRDTSETLGDALAHFEIMQSHAEQDLNDQLVIDAVCMRLSAGIEALAALDPTERQSLFGADWSLMWGMRNRIAHGYLLVDPTVIRATLTHDVPTIVRRIHRTLGIAPIDGDRTEEQAAEPAVSRAKVDPITGVSDEVDRF